MGLNHIYKVIWSKTKNAWVVVSEIAKRDGKSSVKSVVTSLAGKSVAAVMVAMVMCGGVASANTQYGVGADGGFNGTAIGENAKANSQKSTAIGMNAVADGTGMGSIVIGTNAYGMGYNSSPNSVIAIGYGARANTGSGGPTMAIGESAQAEATAGNAMAIGYNSKALGYNGGIAIGSNNTVYGDNIVLGKNSKINQINGADPHDSISIGNINKMDGNFGSLVIGNQNYLMDNSGGFRNFDNILIGDNTKLDGQTNTVIGARYTTITGDYITAIGDVKRDATNWSDNQVVIGHHSAPEAVATVSNTIGVGTTGKTLTLGTFAGSAPSLSVVSFGDSSLGGNAYTRQLKNVAAGVISSTSTDAINGSQLYRAIEALYSLGSPDTYIHVNDGSATQESGTAAANLGPINSKAGATGTKSIAIGMNASAKKDVGVALGNGSVANDEGSVAIGAFYTKDASGVVSYSGANATGKNAISILGTTSGDNAIAIGYNARPARDAIAMGFQTNANEMSIAIGANRNVAGTGSVAIGATTVGNNTTVEADDSLALLGGIQKKSTWGNNVKNSNAIGRGTFITSDNTTMIGSYDDNRFNQYGTDRTRYIAPRSKNIGMMTTYGEGTLENSVYLGHDSFAFTVNSDTDGENSSSGENSIHTKKYDSAGNIVVSNNTTGGAFGKVSKATINGDEITGFAGAQSVGAVTIGAGDYERRIQNVAAGEVSATSTDGINGSQLYAVADTLSKSISGYMHVNDGTATQSAGNATTNFGKINEKGGATGNLAIAIGKDAKAQGNTAIAIGNSSTYANADSSIAMLGNVDSGSKASVAIGTGTRVQGERGTALGMSASTYGVGATALGAVSYAGADGSVSLGYYNSAYAKNSVAIGSFAGTENTAENSVAIGYGASVNHHTKDAVAIGGAKIGYFAMLGAGQEYSTSDNSNSIAIGNGVQVFNKNTVAIGSYDNRTRSLFHLAGSTIPWQTDQNKLITPVTLTRQHMYGGTDTGYTEGTLGNSVYLGHESYAFTPNPLVDDDSHLTGEQSIHTKKYDATGNVVVSNNTTGGAFGKVSKATINGDEITGFAGAQSVGAVTIGAGDYERRIQNVAAGEVSATSTDGINGSQLYAVADTLSKNMSSYMHINDGTSTQTVGNATTNYGYSGSKAGATGNLAIAGGMAAKASGQQSLSLGSYTKSEGDYSVVIGSSHDTSWGGSRGQTFALGNYSVVLGRGAQTWKDNSIAIGHRTEVKGEDSIGIGKYVFTGGYSPVSTEMGSGITAVGTKLGVDGINTNVFGQGNIDNIGGGNPIRANDSTILGNRNSLTGLDSNGQSILPSSINDYATGSHILGNDNQAWGNNAIAIGNKSIVYQNSVAIGYVAKAFGNKSIALGYGANANGENSISIGTGNVVEGAKSSAIGDPSYIDTTATGTHIQGNDNGTATNPIKASESTFMGNTNLAGTAGTTGIHVVGNNNSVDSSNVMVMGNGVNVGTGLDGAVVLGNASSADQYAAATDSTINGVTFEAAGYAGNTGLNNGSIVSVGATGTERQIKNVAAGAVTATSTDAVNGSQLYKTAETILKMPINMAGDSGDTVGLKLGKTVNIKGSVASGADVTDGNIAVVGDKATSTLSLKMAKNLTGLTSGTFTDATGNQTVINGAGVTVTPTGTGATPISITTSGINAGNQEIKGVKKGTTDDAAVNKKQMDDALAGISSTLTINDGTTDGSVNIKTGKLKVVGESGANALVTTTVSGDTITVGTSTKLQNAVTAAENSANQDLSNLSTTGSNKVKTLAQDAVKVAGTGLATVSDATAAGVKTYTVNVDEGKLVIDDTTGKIGAAGASQGTVQGKDGVATTQNVASVVNSAIDKTKQALDDAKHNFAGDDATVISRKHGEQLNIKGGASTTATDLTSGNIAVVGDTTSGTLNIKMAKALTGLTSATYTDAAGNTQTVTGGSSTISDAAGNSTVVSKGGVTTTDGTNTTTVAPTGVTATDGTNTVKLTGSGIDAGNTQIKNVGKATTDDAAVNKKQMDDALKGATDNTVSLGSESGSTTAKKLSTTGGIKFNIKGETGANALITTSASGDDVTIAPTAKLTAAVTAAEKSADKDLSNLSAAGDTYIKNLAKSAASWNVETNGAGTTAVAGGDTVNFINGDNIAITNTGRSITIGTAKNVSFDKVTVGGVVIDKTDGINAGGKEIKGVATGTAADSAVNKAQMDAAITAAAGGSLSTEKVVAKTLTGDNNLATVAGQTGTAKGETYEVSVSENAVKAVAKTAAQDAVKVAGTGLATVSDATAAGVKTYTVNVDEGKLVIDDTTGKLGAAGASQGTVQGKNGVATTQNVADVVNSAIDKTKQALTDAKHDFAGDDATVISRKHGEQLNIKGGASTTATDLTSGNIAVVGDTTSGTLNIKLAKVLTGLTSATYTDAAGNTQTVTGGSSTITDGAGNTTTITKGGMTTTDGTNTTTVAPAGVTATDGTNTVKLTGSGIDAGNTQIKNVGKATTDDAAVNKKQMDDAVKAATDSISTLGDNKVSLGSDAGTTTAKKLSTTGGIKFNIKGDTGANALITTSATGDDVTVAPTAKLTAAVTAAEKSADKDLSNISTAGETVIKNLAATSAQDAVKVTGTGLATVTDSTTGGVKTYNVDVKTGNLVVNAAGQAGATGTTGAGGAAGADGVATTQNVASAINDAITKSKTDTAQAIADAEHKFDGDTGATSVRKHGEVLSVKGGVTTPADLTTGNIGVVSDGAGTLNIRLAKVLSGLTSATYTDGAGNTQTVTSGSSTITDGAGNTTTITKGGMTTTDGTNTTTVAPAGVTATDGTNTVKLNGSGIDAGNTQIKNVGKATTDDAAVNKKQMDDAVKAATDSISTLGDNKVSLGSDSGTTTAKKLSTTGGIKFNIKGDTGANALITTSATGDDVTIAPTAKLTAAVTAAEKSADKDLSNLSAAGDTYIKNLAKTAASWNVETNGAGTTAVAGGETVNFINGDNIAITNTGRSITIGTAKNVSFDKVTVGGIVLDKNTGINAGGKEIKGVANATSADAAVNKGQLDAAVLSAAGGALSIEKVEAGSVANGKLAAGDNNLASVSGLTGTAKNETYTVTVSENAVKAVAQTAAQDAVKVAGTGLATVSDATAAGVKTYTVNVDEGKLVIDDTTGKIGANGATQGTVQGKNGVATTQDVASVVNSAIDKTKQALTDAKHDFAGDDATVISRKHGEQLNIKGGASTTATDLTSGNIAVVGDTTSGTLNIKLAKVLTGLTSATYTDAAGNTQTVTGGSSTITDGAGNTTTITKGGMTTTDGTNTTTVAPAGVTATDGTNTVKLTGSGIDAGNTQIKNVGKATTDDAAVNKKQMDDAVKAATDSISSLGDNKVSLGSDSGTTTAKKLSTTGGIKFNIKGETGANALITTSASGDDVTIAPTAKLTAAVTAAEKSADKDLSNLSAAGETVIKNLAATSAQDAVKVTGTGLATVTDSTTGGVKTYNVDVKTGNLVVNAAGQAGATGTTGAGGAAGADGVATTQNVASAINDAITKSKTDTAQAIADAEHKFDGDTGATSVRKHGEVLSVKGGVTTPADLTTGNIGVVSDGAGTLNIRLAKVLSGLTSASFTNAGGDSTVINGGGVTITPSATGASSISMTTAGINAGNKEIKGVANATSADAAVNKGQMDAAITAAAGGSLSTEKVVAKTLTGDNNLVTVTGQTGTAKGETYEVAVSENAVKAVAQTAAQDAVKVTGTGLANVTDSTTGGVKTYNVDVKTGNLVVNAAGQAGATGTTGAGGAAGADGVATTQNVASAINDAITKSKTDTAQAIADAEHKFDGDTGTTSVRKHGEVLSIKGGVTNTADLTTGNIGVVSDGAGTLNIRLAKVLSGLTSATYTDGAGNTQTVTSTSSTITDGAGNTTTVTKGGMTTTDGTNTTTVAPAGVTATDGTNTVKLNGSGIDAGNTQIKNVGKATTDDAAVNKKQMDDAVKAATDSISTLGDNKVSLGSDAGTTTAKKLSTTGGIKFNIKGDTGANALITTSATGDDVTIAPTAKLTAAVTAAENAANKDLSNLSTAGDTYIKNLAKSAASWNVETNGAGTTAVAGGETVNFINGDNIAITNAGRSITIGTAKNVSFDKVTVGGVVIDKNNGIDAGGKEITNVGPATSGNSAVNKTQMDTAIANAQTAATSTEKVVAKTLTGDTNLATVTGRTGTAKGETYEVAVSENAVKAVAQTAAQDAVKVTGTGLATVTDSTTGGVKTYNVDVKTGNLVVNAAGQAGATGTTGAGGAAGADGVATTQNVASAINDAITKSKTDTAQAIADAEHKFDGDTGATSVRKHGEVLSIKGGVTTPADLTTGNIGVVSDGAGTLNIRLAKTLTGLTSAAFTDGTHTVTIAGSGIDAGNTEIKHVGKATTDDAAVNKKQMDDAVKAATDSVTTLGDNKVSLGSDSGTTTAKKLSTTGGIKFNIKGDTGANALITTSATGDDVTIAPTAKLSAAVTAAENAANKDLSNLSAAGDTYIKNLAKTAASWNVETNGGGTTAVAGGDTVNFINGDNIAITNTGRAITIGTAKNVSFDKVTVGGVVIDKNNGIDAGGKEITNVGPATSGNSAVNKTQMDTAITNAVNKATTDAKHDFGGDDATVVTRKHGEKLNIKGGASTTAADLTAGNIAVLGDAATGTLNIRMAKALTGLSSATFTTPSGTTVINGGGMTITPATGSPISVTTGGINAGNTEIKNVAAGTTPNSAVNKQQMDNAISNATANVGFNTAGNTGTGSVSNGQTLTITGTNGIETSASGQSITVGLDAATRAQINNATTTANNAAKKDLSNIDNAGKQVIKDTAAWNVKVNSGAPEIVKGGDTVTFNDGDNIKVTNTGKDITIATKKDVSFDKVTVGNVVIDKNTNRISGLANAANNDEAVNLGQMNAAISTATAGTGNIKYKANGGTQNSVALTTGFDFKGDSNIQITADPANSGVINYKLNPALTGITSISGGTGAPTITLNAGSGSTPGNVSINSNLDMGGKQINNIGAATHAGDAVNKAQMDQALQNIAGASSNVAKSYAYKAGAGAAALAALKPIQYDPLEPTQIMAGIGNYKSQTAVALGVAHYTNENTMFNLGVSLDSHDGIVNAGVTHKFGYSPEKKAIPDRYKGGPISSIYVMQDEVTALQAIVQKQAAENEALRQQNEDMQRKVDMILSKIH